MSAPIGPEPLTSTRAPRARSPSRLTPWSAIASGSASTARRSGSSGGRTRSWAGETSSSSTNPPWVWGCRAALPR
jgi:hypothetical protein